jgi:hypothetical protein
VSLSLPFEDRSVADRAPPRNSDLIAAVDILRPMMLNRTLGNVPSLRLGIWDAAVYGSKDKYWPENAGRPLPEDVEDRILRDEDLGHWIFYGSSILRPAAELGSHRRSSYLKARCTVPTLSPHRPGSTSSPNSPPSRACASNSERTSPSAPTCTIVRLSLLGCLPGANWTGKSGFLTLANCEPGFSPIYTCAKLTEWPFVCRFFAPISPVSGVDAKKQAKMCKDRCVEYVLPSLSLSSKYLS